MQFNAAAGLPKALVMLSNWFTRRRRRSKNKTDTLIGTIERKDQVLYSLTTRVR